MIIKSKIYYLDEVESTNEYLRSIIGDASEGTVVISDRQTMGKGRYGRTWYSPEGGLWMSSLLISTQPQLMTLIGCVAICETMNSYDILLGIKWPNDIMLNGKKVGGVLADTIDGKVILGLGLNLNVRDFPDDIELVSTSVYIELKKKFDKMMIFDVLCKEIDDQYGMYKANRIQDILMKWRHYTIMLGRNIRIDSADRVIIGRAIDISADGGLVVTLTDGKIERILEGSCSFQ
jgi:BirA family biotin operon repressor/biotin-[acetyl-CoA-carboxylase] ligase